MVLSAEKKSKATKKELANQPKRLNSSTAAKKSVKKEPKEKLFYNLITKDFNDSVDFITPQNRRKLSKNEKSPTEISNSANRKEKTNRTSQRSKSCSSQSAATDIRTPTRRRTRSSDQKINEDEKKGESLTAGKPDLLKSPPSLLPASESTVKGSLASKSAKCSSQELKKQMSQTSKVNKVKVETPDKVEKLKQTSVKKPAKLEQVKSVTPKVKNCAAATREKQPKRQQTSRAKTKPLEPSDTVKSPEKSSTKVENPTEKNIKKTNMHKNSSPQTPIQQQPTKNGTPKSVGHKGMLSKCTPKKKEKEKDVTENKHLSPLLSMVAAKKKTSPNVESSTRDQEESNCSSSGQNSTVKCPTCKGLIPEESLGRHILMCLKKKYQAGAKHQLPVFSDEEQLQKDEILARQIHEDLNKDAVNSKESVGTEEINFCHICQKDLTQMNSMWKTKHINQCFDDADKKTTSKKNKTASVTRQQVPTCPMCGKLFKTWSLRRCHLKKCAQELSVSPEKALKLIREQEKSFKLPQPTTTTSTTESSSTSSSSSSHNKNNKFPDEQMQMAIAMSSSLFEEQEKLNNQLVETVKNIHQGVNRELRKLKRSKKKAGESTPPLLTVSKADRLLRNAERVDSIISEPVHTVHLSRQFPPSSLSLNCGDVYRVPENVENTSLLPSLWSRASLMKPSLASDSFYVQSLMPPIQVDAVVAGSRLKSLSAIPGREVDEEETSSSSAKTFPDSSIIPSTQTAVLLAELAQSNEEELDDEVSEGSVKQSQGFCLTRKTIPIPGNQENSPVSALIEDFCGLVNNPHLSDVQLVAANGSHVFAHRLLLSVRCPQILDLAVLRENFWVIEMKGVSHNSVLAFLRYVYAGQVDFDKNVTADLLQLSRKFDLPQLSSICERTLQALIDEACYTPSVESVVTDAPECFDIGEVHQLENEDDDKIDDVIVDIEMMPADRSGDTLSGIKEPPPEESLKTSQYNALHVSSKSSKQELPSVNHSEICQTTTESTDVEFLPQRQNKRKPVPIPYCQTLTDGNVSVTETASKLGKIFPSSIDVHSCRDVSYRISESSCLKLSEKIGTTVHCSDTVSQQNVSSLTRQVSVLPEEIQDKELPATLVSSDTGSRKMPTSFVGLLSKKCSGRRSNEARNTDTSLNGPDLNTDVSFATVSNKHSYDLPPMNSEEDVETIFKENSLNLTSGSCAISDCGFDDSNELFSEHEDIQDDTVSMKVAEDKKKKLEIKSQRVEESMEDPSDSICFVTENQQNVQATTLSSTALCLADTVCENSVDEGLVSGSYTPKIVSPANRLQVSNCTLSNGNTTGLQMTDTIPEVIKTFKDTSNPLCMTVTSPLSATVLQESSPNRSILSAKNRNTFSPCPLSSLDNANHNSRATFDPNSGRHKLSSRLSTSPKFSFSPINVPTPDIKAKNLVSLVKDSLNALSNAQHKKRKRKSCDMDPVPSPKRSQRKRLKGDDKGSDETVESYFTGSHFSKGTNLRSPFKNAKSSVAIDNLSDVVSTDSHLPFESTTIPLDLKDFPPKRLNNSQTINLEEKLDILDSLPNSPANNLARNLDTFSRLSEDSITDDESHQFRRTILSLEHNSDLEMEPDSKNVKFSDSNLERDPDCFPGNRSMKTPEPPKKKFTFKRSQLINFKSPVVCPSVSSFSPVADCSPAKKDLSIPKYSGHLRRPLEDQAHLSDRVDSDCEYQPDVWDDFEDNGYMEDFVALPSSSPARQNASPTDFMSAKMSVEMLDCSDSFPKSVSPRTSEVDDEIVNVESFNASFINDFLCSSSPVMSQTESSLQASSYASLSLVDAQGSPDKAKTPLIMMKRGRKKEPTIPSPFTPMPSYAQMTTPELKKEMKRHGCKQMTRKKMVTLLQNIYQKTHQYETDSDLDYSILKSNSLSEVQSCDQQNISLQTRSKTQDSLLQSYNEKVSPVAIKSIVKKPDLKISKKGKSPAQADSTSPVRLSPESELINLNDFVPHKANAVGAYEESFIASEEDIPASQLQASASSDNLHDKLRTVVLKNPEMYTKMLFYEPMDFDQLKKKIAEAKIKCSAAKLLGFLDNHCITFAMNKEKQHHGTWKPRVAKK